MPEGKANITLQTPTYDSVRLINAVETYSNPIAPPDQELPGTADAKRQASHWKFRDQVQKYLLIWLMQGQFDQRWFPKVDDDPSSICSQQCLTEQWNKCTKKGVWKLSYFIENMAVC